jgi:hypothetical protein
MAMTVGGWLGWEAGALVSVFTGYVLSVVGAAVALYVVNRFRVRYLP